MKFKHPNGEKSKGKLELYYESREKCQGRLRSGYTISLPAVDPLASQQNEKKRVEHV